MLPILRPPGFDLDRLARIQQRIAKQVRQQDGFKKLKTIAGCDVSFARGDIAYAACAVLDYRRLEIIDHRTVKTGLKFPYIPTFLAFRELEGLMKAVQGINADVFMVGAQGLAHPRRAGLACHLGVTLGKPTLVVAKSKLCGEAPAPDWKRGAYTLLKDEGETMGAVVRTKSRVKPVYVSVGHKLSLKTAIKITLDTAREYRLPEPIRAAHKFATRAAHIKS